MRFNNRGGGDSVLKPPAHHARTNLAARPSLRPLDMDLLTGSLETNTSTHLKKDKIKTKKQISGQTKRVFLCLMFKAVLGETLEGLPECP